MAVDALFAPRLFQLTGEGKSEELRALLAGGTIKSVRVTDTKGITPINTAVLAESLETIQVRFSGSPALGADWGAYH